MRTLTPFFELPISERSEALRRFGYSTDEAAFLALAALSGGCTLRRQAAEFLRKKDGGAITVLVQKALDREHVRCSTWAKGVNLYHLGSRPFYDALGEQDNRNRRRHELAQIKNRLMALDFFLAHRDAPILATERDRLMFFDRLGVSRELLPQRLFISRSASQTTTRYFVDRQPILGPRPSDVSGTTITFAFVDEGLVTLSRFERFLSEHARLFGALETFALLYVADSQRHFAAAADLAQSTLHSPVDHALPLTGRTDAKLLGYFALRKRFEERELSAFNREQLLELRDGKHTFFGAEIEEQYRLWRAQGTLSIDAFSSKHLAQTVRAGKSFSTELLPHDYALFGHFLPQ